MSMSSSKRHYTSRSLVVLILILTFLICSLIKIRKEEGKLSKFNDDTNKYTDKHTADSETNSKSDIKSMPILNANELIYTEHGNIVYSPIVNEEYKLIFFVIAKVASSEWKRLFTRMIGDPSWCDGCIHKTAIGLKHLYDYDIHTASQMMTSPEWTRAIFVRDPRERLLSAFLDKAVQRTNHFKKEECLAYSKRGGDILDCVHNHLDFHWFVSNFTLVYDDQVHWMPIYPRIDEKWWPYIDFIGYMHTISDDAQTLLQTIHSTIDGSTAWNKWGKTGWSGDERNCETAVGDLPFLGKKDSKHAQDTLAKLRQYFTPELEDEVIQRWSSDFHNPYFSFPLDRLFPEEH